ncbi:MAG: type II toxin-antitoxin system HicA family toxin [Desulfopila sp.]
MKRRDLIKKLKAKGALMIRQGRNHEVWQSRSGYTFTVPRHAEINELTSRGILEQAEK